MLAALLTALALQREPSHEPTPPRVVSGSEEAGAPTARAPWLEWWERNRVLFRGPRRISDPVQVEGPFFLPPGGTKLALRLTLEGVEATRTLLLDALAREREATILAAVLDGLARIGGPARGPQDLVPKFLAFLRREDLREEVLYALAVLADPAAIPALLGLLEDSREGRELSGAAEVDGHTRALAAYALARIGWCSPGVPPGERARTGSR